MEADIEVKACVRGEKKKGLIAANYVTTSTCLTMRETDSGSERQRGKDGTEVGEVTIL